MRKILAMLAFLSMLGEPALATSVKLDSALYVERIGSEVGIPVRTVEPAENLRQGERVVAVLRWRSASDTNAPFSLTSKVPEGLRYQKGNGTEQMSIDGGVTFTDTVAIDDRVTHLRWRVSARDAVRGHGQVSYRAVVR